MHICKFVFIYTCTLLLHSSHLSSSITIGGAPEDFQRAHDELKAECQGSSFAERIRHEKHGVEYCYVLWLLSLSGRKGGEIRKRLHNAHYSRFGRAPEDFQRAHDELKAALGQDNN